MANGIVAVQQGVGLDKALDSQKVLDSRWRYFEIAQEKLLTLPTLRNDGSVQVIYQHDMGFLPAFDVYDVTLGTYILGSDTLGNGLVSNTTQLYFNGVYIDQGWSGHQVMIRVYDVPITEEYTAIITETNPVKTSTVSGQGVKVLQTTGDFADLELSEFSLSTSSKALSIQKTGIATANSGTNNQVVIRHDLGYPPTFLSTYVDFNKQWVSAIDPDFNPIQGSANGTNLTFSGVQSILVGSFAYIIFKELGDFAL